MSFTTAQQQQLLATLLEKHVQWGYSIVEHMGKPLDSYDFSEVEEGIAYFESKYEKVAIAQKTQ